MELSPKTKINELLSGYPFLLEFFLGRSPKFKVLKNPLTRKTVGKLATMTQVASIGELDLDQLLADIAREIKEKTGEQVAIKQAMNAAEAPAPEDREARQEILKGIIRDLHNGEEMAILKQRFHDLIKNIDASEIAAMEQGLIDEGMPASEVKRLCDVHVEVFEESLSGQATPETPPGHPVHTFMLENRAAEEILRELTHILAKASDSKEADFIEQYRGDLEQLMRRLAGIDLHYLRKENQLFPLLEAYDITGPSQVMWALHDDIREALKTVKTELASPRGSEALNTIRYVTKSIEDMIYKEENILFPMAMETLSEADWKKVSQGDKEIGFAWVVPKQEWAAAATYTPVGKNSVEGAVSLQLATGRLTPEQVNLILIHLPVEISFVDENDEVCYYSQVQEKIFPRSAGVIGRKVQNCHPASSLHKVQMIIDEFRSGKKDVAEFWIERKGRFIYIRYFAVRDGNGTYRGTVEVVQDTTEIRGLTGQKRLLESE